MENKFKDAVGNEFNSLYEASSKEFMEHLAQQQLQQQQMQMQQQMAAQAQQHMQQIYQQRQAMSMQPMVQNIPQAMFQPQPHVAQPPSKENTYIRYNNRQDLSFSNQFSHSLLNFSFAEIKAILSGTLASTSLSKESLEAKLTSLYISNETDDKETNLGDNHKLVIEIAFSNSSVARVNPGFNEFNENGDKPSLNDPKYIEMNKKRKLVIAVSSDYKYGMEEYTSNVCFYIVEDEDSNEIIHQTEFDIHEVVGRHMSFLYEMYIRGDIFFKALKWAQKAVTNKL